MFNDVTMSPRPRIKSGLLDFKYEKAYKKIKESFWGDFLMGGLLVSGIFIIVDNLNLPQEVSINIGVINICLALLLMLVRLAWPKISKYRIHRMIVNATNLYKTKQYIKAIKSLEKIFKIDPKIKEVWFNKGIALNMLGRQVEEIECYNKALEIDPDFTHPIYNKACVGSLRDNKQESINHLKRVIELDKTYIEKAKLDADFDNIRDSDEFKELIG